MRKLPCILLITVIVCAVFPLGAVRASTPVNGILTSNTTWTLAQSPIQLVGPVCVYNDVTLTIEPGVTVDFGAFYLQVNGTLVARGTSDNKITMMITDTSYNPDQKLQFYPSSTAWNEATGKGCIVENVVFNSVSIAAKGASPKITHNIFTCRFRMAVYGTDGGSPTFTGNVVQGYLEEGMSVGGSSVITGNLFNATGRGMATAIVAHDNTYVANNKITNFYIGILADTHGSVTGNVITYSQEIGIWSLSSDANIQHNYIMNGQTGISGGGNIQSNTIINNSKGIQNQGTFSQAIIQATIKNNNIVQNQYNVVLNNSQNLDVANNWWGTTDTQAISLATWDSNHDFNLGTVNYLPILTAPDPSAPTSADIDLSAITTPPPTSPTQQPTNPPPTSPSTTAEPTPDKNPVTQPQQNGTPISLDHNTYVIVVAVGIAVGVIALLAVLISRSKDVPAT